MDNKLTPLMLVLTILASSACKELDSLRSSLTEGKEENNTLAVSTYSSDTPAQQAEETETPATSSDNDNEDEDNSESTTTDESSEAQNANENAGTSKNEEQDTNDALEITAAPETTAYYVIKSPEPYIYQPSKPTDPYSLANQIPGAGKTTLIDYQYEKINSGGEATPLVSSLASTINNQLVFPSLPSDDNAIVSAFSYTLGLGALLHGIDFETHTLVYDTLVGTAALEDWYNSFQSLLLSSDMTVENQFWGQEQYLFLNNYLNTLKQSFVTEFTSHDFITHPYTYISDVNDWFATASDNSIPTLAPDVDNPERIRIANAFNAKLNAQWRSSLNVKEEMLVFERLDGEQFWTPMVVIEGDLKTFENEGVKVTEIPLDSESLSLIKIEPAKDQFHQTRESLDNIIDSFQKGKSLAPGSVTVPTFSIKNENSIRSDILTSDLYSEYQADFSRINGEGYLYVDSINNKTAFELTESGIAGNSASLALLTAYENEPDTLFSGFSTSAMFSQSAGCANTYIEPKLPDALPFYFAVYDNNTNTVLFLGKLQDTGGTRASGWVCYEVVEGILQQTEDFPTTTGTNTTP